MVTIATKLKSTGELVNYGIFDEVTFNQEIVYVTPGTYSWTVPQGVTSVSVVCIGGGGGGVDTTTNIYSSGGGGGGLGYKNAIAVTPGDSITVVVGAGGAVGSNGGDSYFVDAVTVAGLGGTVGSGNNTGLTIAGGAGGSFVGDAGGVGGAGGGFNSISAGYVGGGGGAGGYSGTGGAGGLNSNNGSAGTGGSAGGGSGDPGNAIGGGGGGVGIWGLGANGSAGMISTVAAGGGGGSYGATGSLGAALASSQNTGVYGGGGTGFQSGAGGAVRIVWADNSAFPSTNVYGSGTLSLVVRTALTGTSNITMYADEFDEVTYNPISTAITNLLAYSEDFTQVATWSNTATTVTANATRPPNILTNNTNNGTAITNTGVVTSLVAQTLSTTVTGTSTVTMSVFAKANTASAFTFNGYYVGDTESNVDYTLTGAGTVGALGNAVSASISLIDNGWYRCVLTCPANVTAQSTTFAWRIWPILRGASTTTGCFFWGAQLTKGTEALTYVGKGATGILTPSFSQKTSSSATVYVTALLNEVPTEIAFTTPGIYNWTAPVNVTAVNVLVIGGGGGSAASSSPGGGGGGLAYGNNIPVVPGVNYTITVGTGGAVGVAGTISWFNTSIYLFANGGGVGTGGSGVGGGGGGGGAAGYSAAGGAGGGAATLSIGTVGAGGTAGGTVATASFTGGAGGLASSANAAFNAAGAGVGGAAGGGSGGFLGGVGGGGVGIYGTGTNGTAGTATLAGAQGAVAANGGSAGGNGAQASGANVSGGSYGGGAGGTALGSQGQSGAVRIIWVPGSSFPATSVANSF